MGNQISTGTKNDRDFHRDCEDGPTRMTFAQEREHQPWGCSNVQQCQHGQKDNDPATLTIRKQS